MQNLQKKHALLEADVGSHQDRIEGIRVAASQFVERGHFDADNIKAKEVCFMVLSNACLHKGMIFCLLVFCLKM